MNETTTEAPFEIIMSGDESPGILLPPAPPAAEPAPPPAAPAPAGEIAPAVAAIRSGEKWMKVLHFGLLLALVLSIALLLRFYGDSSQLAKSPPAAAPPASLADAGGSKTEAPAPPEPPPAAASSAAAPAPEKPPAALAPRETPPEKPEPAPAPSDPGPSLEDMQVAALIEEAADLAQRNAEEAIANYAKVLEMRPGRTDLWKRIADLQLERGDRPAAAKAYRLFLNDHPQRADALNNLGVIELQAGRFQEAQKCLEAAIAAAPSATAYHNLGNLHLQRGLLDLSAAAYRRALEYQPAHASSRFNLALVLEKQSRLAEAAALLAGLSPESPEAARERARIEAMMGGAEAKRAMAAALAATDPGLVVAVAVGFRRAGELEKALALFDRAVELAPLSALVRCDRGAIRQAMGRTAQAIEDYEAALKADPGYADAHFNLGVLHEERGQPVKALEHYAAALKAQPTMAPAHNNVGVLYLAVQQPVKAVECFRRAVESDAQFAAARLNLAWAYLALDWKDRALEELRAYVALVPKDQCHPAALKTIEKLEKR